MSDGVIICGEWFRGNEAPRAVVLLSHAMMVDRRTLDRPAGQGALSALWLPGCGCCGLISADTDRASRGRLWARAGTTTRCCLMWRRLRHTYSKWRRMCRSRCWTQSIWAPGAGVAGALGRRGRCGRVLMAWCCWRRMSGCVGTSLGAFAGWPKTVVFGAALGGATLGYLPALRLGIGSDDEPYAYLAQMGSWVFSGDWADRHGHSFWPSFRG